MIDCVWTAYVCSRSLAPAWMVCIVHACASVSLATRDPLPMPCRAERGRCCGIQLWRLAPSRLKLLQHPDLRGKRAAAFPGAGFITGVYKRVPTPSSPPALVSIKCEPFSFYEMCACSLELRFCSYKKEESQICDLGR